MKTFLLDTSALLAHYRNEAGAARIQAMIDETDNEVLICALSVTELARRLKALGATGSARLPLADALIAACAAITGATLVHRDPHFEGSGRAW